MREPTINPATLHYVYDPLCGWCYAASPLVRAARDVMPVVAHGGGMMTGPRRQHVSPAWRAHVGPNDRRIAELTGQVFGPGYRDGLLHDASAVLDSEPPTTAVLAAERVAGRGLDLLEALYRAHYVDGRRTADPAVLAGVAADVGLDGGAFGRAFDELAGEPTRSHFARSRTLLASVGGHGFPTFAVERDGRIAAIDHHPYLGDPDGWRAALHGHAGTVPRPVAGPAVGCGPDGCAIG